MSGINWSMNLRVFFEFLSALCFQLVRMEGSNNLLQNLPSRGLCAKASVSSRVRTASAPLYLPTHDTSPPPDQFITTDKTSKLLRRFHEIMAERESRQGKRCHNEVSAPTRDRERQRQKIWQSNASIVKSGATLLHHLAANCRFVNQHCINMN